MTLTATGGGITHSTTVTLSVMDFSISVSPSLQTVRRGGSTSYTVAVNPINGYGFSVAFTALSGLPAGATYSPNPLSAAVSPGSGFTLTITTGRNTPKRTYTMTLSAQGSGATTALTRSASFQLRVRN